VLQNIYLVKDNNKLVSWCKCRQALITYPPQAECPWCGCGWLFTCIKCRKAFTFTRGLWVNETWEATARCDLTNQSGSEPSQKEIKEWVESMKRLLGQVEVGQKYVCLDGRIIPTNAPGVHFDGWFARHDFDFIPHVAALRDPKVEDDYLGNPAYWFANALNRE